MLFISRINIDTTFICLGRKKYAKWTPQQRAEIGRYASTHGVTAAVRHYQGKYPQLKKQTVFEFKASYEKQRKDTGKEVHKLATKKRGRPKLLPEKVMEKTVTLIKALRLKGAPANVNVINAVAKGIVIANDRTLLIEHGGYLSFSKQWGRNILNEAAGTERRMLRRMATTSKVPIAPGLIREDKYTFQKKINGLVKWHSIPPDLVLNFDQTPLSYITVGNTTLEFEDATSVPVKYKRKSNQITWTFTISASGMFLPMQLIYAGKTERCHPQGIKFPSGLDVTHSENHWSNEILARQHVTDVIMSYAKQQRKELGLSDDHKCLLIFNVFKGQTTDAHLQFLDENNFSYVFVPPNLTNHFQPLDLNVNSHTKTFLKETFQQWYAQQVQKKLDSGKNIYQVDIETKLSIMKPIHARWIISLMTNFVILMKWS